MRTRFYVLGEGRIYSDCTHATSNTILFRLKDDVVYNYVPTLTAGSGSLYQYRFVLNGTSRRINTDTFVINGPAGTLHTVANSATDIALPTIDTGWFNYSSDAAVVFEIFSNTTDSATNPNVTICDSNVNIQVRRISDSVVVFNRTIPVYHKMQIS